MPRRRTAFALGCCVGAAAMALRHRTSGDPASRTTLTPAPPSPSPVRETVARLEAELERTRDERDALAAEVERLNEIDRRQGEAFLRDNADLRRRMDELADALLLKAGV